MVYFLIAQGFEEAEAVIPHDILTRAKKNCVFVSFSDTLTVKSSHGLNIVCDELVKNVDFSDAECIVFPGGGEGTDNLHNSPYTDRILALAIERKIFIAAICAAPSILGKRGLLRGKNITCYPGFEEYCEGAKVLDFRVVCDGKIITAKGAGAAYEFAYKIVEKLSDKQTAEIIKEKIY